MVCTDIVFGAADILKDILRPRVESMEASRAAGLIRIRQYAVECMWSTDLDHVSIFWLSLCKELIYNQLLFYDELGS